MTDTCDTVRRLLERRLADEADASERARLAEHCAHCAACAELCAVDGALRAATEQALPRAAELAEVRRAVLRQARLAAPAPAATAIDRFLGLRVWQQYALAATLALALLGAGVAFGHLARDASGAEDPLIGALRAQLRQGAGAGDPLESPLTFANVRAEAAAPGRLRLEFDVSAHLALERPATDPLVGQVIAQTLLAGTSPVGGRLKAIAVADQTHDHRVRDALAAAAETDSSAAVRLKAFAELARRRGDVAVETTALRLLAGDGSVQLRLAAIDYLTGNGVDPAALRRALAAADPETRGPLLVRAATYLQRN